MHMKRLSHLSCLALLLVFFSASIKAQVSLDNKAQLTAAFIYQITKFTFWPDSLYQQNDPAFSICVLGKTNEQLLAHLQELETKSTQGYKIEVVPLHNNAQLLERSGTNCKVLYAADKEWQNLKAEQIDQLTQTTLLIGSSKTFLQQGGMLALLVVNNKMKIFINSTNLDKTPIRLESRLKALAKAF